MVSSAPVAGLQAALRLLRDVHRQEYEWLHALVFERVVHVLALDPPLALRKLHTLAIGPAFAKRPLEDVDELGTLFVAVDWHIAAGFEGDYSPPKVTALKLRD